MMDARERPAPLDHVRFHVLVKGSHIVKRILSLRQF